MASRKQQGTVFVVEDNADTRAGLSDALEGDGFEVFATGNGREVLEKLRTAPRPAAIVLDLYMPGLSGFEIYRVLHDDPRLASIPLVVVTAASPTQRTGLDVSATIRKPVELHELLFTVRRVVAEGKPSPAT
jgi:two-component system phosphate regulon response regulator PhoB